MTASSAGRQLVENVMAGRRRRSAEGRPAPASRRCKSAASAPASWGCRNIGAGVSTMAGRLLPEVVRAEGVVSRQTG